MLNEIQKYTSYNTPPTKPNDNRNRYFKKPFLGILLAVIFLGLGIFVANGLFEKQIAVIITFLIVSVLIILHFNKYRMQLNNYQYWIGITISIIFFAIISFQLFFKSSTVSPNNPRTIPLSKDTLITILNDSLQRIKSLNLPVKSNTIKKLEMVNKDFKSIYKPILSISEFVMDTLLPNKHVSLHCTLENNGNALAKNISYYTSVNLHSKPYYDGLFPPGKIIKSPPLAPSKKIYLSWVDTKLLSQEWYDRIQSKKYYLYFYGNVYYFNEFGIKDSTAFCVFFDFNENYKFYYNNSHNY